jgi:mannose-6-phosphate isomerase-like protein (cupin superfamily)
MKHGKLKGDEDFCVVLGNRRSQAAEMILAPGKSEGGSDNRHRGSDQGLYVVSGTGRAIVKGKHYPLKAGRLILIEQGETHETRNTGTGKLRILNIYVPPAYRKDGDPLPSGRN